MKEIISPIRMFMIMFVGLLFLFGCATVNAEDSRMELLKDVRINILHVEITQDEQQFFTLPAIANYTLNLQSNTMTTVPKIQKMKPAQNSSFLILDCQIHNPNGKSIKLRNSDFIMFDDSGKKYEGFFSLNAEDGKAWAGSPHFNPSIEFSKELIKKDILFIIPTNSVNKTKFRFLDQESISIATP